MSYDDINVKIFFKSDSWELKNLIVTSDTTILLTIITKKYSARKNSLPCSRLPKGIGIEGINRGGKRGIGMENSEP
jgi:hypothetical protein